MWRLRLPLPWPGVPHGNAWAVAAGDGVVLFDTGVHETETDEHPASWSELELAMAQVGLRVADVRLVVCTHAHADHYGQAAALAAATGSEVWLHPDHRHTTGPARKPDAAWERRLEVGLQSGVPESDLRRYRDARSGSGNGLSGLIEPDRALVTGVEVETDLGRWQTIETPGHAPSHVSLFQPESGLLISGDHLLGRVSPYFDYGWTPDPVAEFLDSLDRIEPLGAQLCLAGHGRPFRDVRAHIDANRREVASRTDALAERLGAEPATAFELLPDGVPPEFTPWVLTETLAYLTWLSGQGRAERSTGDDGRERWRRVEPRPAGR